MSKNLQYHYEKYNHDSELQNHLKSMVKYLQDSFDNYLHFSEGSISFRLPSSDTWAWIDTYKNGDKYDLLFKNRFINQHGLEDLDLENTNGIKVKTGNKRCPRFNIYKDFDLNQSSFHSFLANRYSKYKKHKENGYPDCISQGNDEEDESEINYWIFQGSPDVFDVVGQLKEGKESWHVNSHKKEIQPGDKALLYITGKNAGFYGTAEITSEVYSISHNDLCDIEIEDLFLDKPIMKDTIINNPILRKSNAGSQGSNFRSSKEEYDEVIKLYQESKIPASKYQNFNGLDLKLLKIAFEEYLKFSKENPEREEYKYKVMEDLQNELNINKIRVENINRIVDILKKNNPNSGSFFNWRNIDDFSNYVQERPAEVVQQLNMLFENDTQSISSRIDEFLDKAREFQSEISLGTPFFGYLMWAFDSDNYVIYKDKTFKRFCKWFDLNVPFNIGDKYEYYISVCNELLDFAREHFDKDMILLNMQDFIYTVARYPEARFRTLLRYINEIVGSSFSIKLLEKSRVKNLLKDIHSMIINEERLGEIEFKEGKYISESLHELPKYKYFMYFYPAAKSSHKDAVSFFLGIDKDNKVTYGLFPGKSIEQQLDPELDTKDVDEIEYDMVIEKYEENIDKFQEYNDKENFETPTKEESEEQLKISLPGVYFDRKIKINNLFFPDKERLINQISIALKTGKNIILIGPPGTGKSKLAKIICRQYIGDNNYSMATATSDWSTFETIGGYQPDSDNRLTFRPGLFLECFKTSEKGHPANQWLIIDEINRADIDKAFGSLFSALTGDRITLNYKGKSDKNIVVRPQQEDEDIPVNDYEYVIPVDWRLIATMNTFDKTSLYEMSYAFMRRFAFIPVNVPVHIDNNLIKEYLKCWDITDYRFVEDSVTLWKTVNKYRKIGPALIEDIYKYLIESDGDYSSAVIMYLFPQLEGLMLESLQSILQELMQFDENNLISSFAVDYFGLERMPDEA